MNGNCDTCGDLASGRCDAIGCGKEMCEAHTKRRMAASIGTLPGSDIPVRQVQKFCPEHAYLAQQ